MQTLLRQIRQQAGLRQSDLAIRLKKPQPFVSRYEIGGKMLDLPGSRQVCHALGLSLLDFVQRYEQALYDFD